MKISWYCLSNDKIYCAAKYVWNTCDERCFCLSPSFLLILRFLGLPLQRRRPSIQLPDRIWIHAGADLNAGYTWWEGRHFFSCQNPLVNSKGICLGLWRNGCTFLPGWKRKRKSCFNFSFIKSWTIGFLEILVDLKLNVFVGYKNYRYKKSLTCQK